MSLEPGLKGSAETVVVHENTAAAVGSGALEVFATPSMIGLMEKAAMDAVMPYLAEGESTVGTEIHVTHDAALPLGFPVTAEAELVEVDRRRLSFRVLARSKQRNNSNKKQISLSPPVTPVGWQLDREGKRKVAYENSSEKKDIMETAACPASLFPLGDRVRMDRRFCRECSCA